MSRRKKVLAVSCFLVVVCILSSICACSASKCITFDKVSGVIVKAGDARCYMRRVTKASSLSVTGGTDYVVNVYQNIKVKYNYRGKYYTKELKDVNIYNKVSRSTIPKESVPRKKYKVNQSISLYTDNNEVYICKTLEDKVYRTFVISAGIFSIALVCTLVVLVPETRVRNK